MLTLEKALQLFAAWLQLAFFVLMCVGLLLASYFLHVGLITGDNWVAVCGILFTADRIANAITGRQTTRHS